MSLDNKVVALFFKTACYHICLQVANSEIGVME